MFDIKENLKRLPDKPGVYMHKDALGHVIYVGKAVSLKNRVRQYFQSQTNMAPKVRSMVAHIEEFEYITTDSEMEALILECNLIKKYMPKYNVLLRDDKTYPYIKVTMREDYPRIVKTRRIVDDGAKYFGPYSDVGAVNEIIDMLNEIYVLKRCSSKTFPVGFRPCLNYHIGQCRGICAGHVSKAEYRDSISEVVEFLKGHNKKLLDSLTEKMMQASEALNFEKAAEYRDRINAVKAITEKQKVVLGAANDMDMILTANSSSGYHIILFFVRNGKLSGRESFHMDDAGLTGMRDVDAGGAGAAADQAAAEQDAGRYTDTDTGAAARSAAAAVEHERGELIAEFIKQYYTKDMLIPKEIAVEYEPPDGSLLEEWLTAMRGSKVKLFTPQKGDKHALLEMARRDVVEMMKVLDDRAAAKSERENAVAAELDRLFGEKRRRFKMLEMVRAARDTGETRAHDAARAAEAPAVYKAPAGTDNTGNISGPAAAGAESINSNDIDIDGEKCSWRIESYDISNISGVDSVGGMVVFENGRPQRKSYRKFKIKTVDGPDDYSSMQEVIYRRFRRAQKGDPGFSHMPDIIFVDGGLGHVHAVQEVLDAMDLHIIVAGMVKDDRHRTRGLFVDEKEVDLKERPALFRYVTTIQDEVHRFSIDYHHGLRSKSMQKSILDDAPGIGERRKKALLSRFGSIENMRKADVSELAETEGMTMRAAESLKLYLAEKEKEIK